MNRKWILALTVAACVSGCGSDSKSDDGEGGGKPSSPSGTISSSNAATVSTSTDKAASMGNPMAMNEGSLRAVGFDFAELSAGASSGQTLHDLKSMFLSRIMADDDGSECADNGDSTGSDATDADSDGFQKLIKLNFKGKTCSFSSSTYKMSGAYKLEDADDSKAFPLAGITVTYDNLKYEIEGTATTTAGSQSYKITLTTDGSYKITVDSSTGATTADANIKSSGDYLGKSFSNQYWVKSTMTPTDAASPKAAGAVDFSGYFKRVDIQGKTIGLKVTSQELKYSSTCTSGAFLSGKLIYEAGTGKMIYTYTNCSVAKTYE